MSDAQTGSTVRVVILDVSQSMAAVQHGVETIQRARTISASHLRYRLGLRANLIIAGARPRAVFTQPSQNFEALRGELSRVQVRPERLDVNRAITLAAEMLSPQSGQDQRRRELVVVSDFQRSNWARADFSPLPQQTQIQLESAADARSLENLALLRAEVRGRGSAGTTARLEVEVGNYSPAARRVTVEVVIGNSTYRVEGNCTAHRRATLVNEIKLPAAGWQVGQARLVGVDDSLAADNGRGLVVEVRDKPLFVLITRQPTNQRPSSSHYLECALVPDGHLAERASAHLVRMNPANLNRQRLAAADLIVIDHPGKISADSLGLLADLMRRGRPMLYVAAEIIDAVNLRLLSDAAGSGLQMPVEFAPPPPGQLRRDLFLTSVRRDAAPFNVFGESTTAIVNRLRFAGGLSSRRHENTLDDDVLATYSDGTSCLILTSSDAGALAVLNADLNKSTLPKTGVFVPLLDQLVLRLLERRKSSSIAVCGEPLVVHLPSSVSSAHELTISGPDTTEPATTPSHGKLVEEGIGVIWRWQAPSVPGVYRVQRAGQTIFAMPIHVAEEESQLETLSAEVLKERLAGGRAVHYRPLSGSAENRDVLWTWLLIACVVCMLAEMAALAEAFAKAKSQAQRLATAAGAQLGKLSSLNGRTSQDNENSHLHNYGMSGAMRMMLMQQARLAGGENSDQEAMVPVPGPVSFQVMVQATFHIK